MHINMQLEAVGECKSNEALARFLRGAGAALRSMPVQRSHHSDPREHRWPVISATSINAGIAACHSGASCSALGSLVM